MFSKDFGVKAELFSLKHASSSREFIFQTFNDFTADS